MEDSGDDLPPDGFGFNDEEPDPEATDRSMRKLQSNFRRAAGIVASKWSEFAWVEKIVLFGSVALPLRYEVPRFNPYRRMGIEVLHECMDVDLAVWTGGNRDLRALQKARSRALQELLEREKIGVAHHQVDAFLMETGTGAYLGRLCKYRTCTKDRRDCRAPGCGSIPLLRQHEDFLLNPLVLVPPRAVVLFERRR
jgi:hypothetical protein